MRIRKLLSLLLALCLVLSCLPLGAAAAETIATGVCGDNAAWTLDSDGLLTISGTGSTWDKGPMSVNGGWSEYDYQIYRVKVEEGITGLGTHTFNGLWECGEITLPSTLTTIGDYALRNCSVYSLTIPAAVTSLGTWSLPGNLYNLYFLGNAPVFAPDCLEWMEKTVVSYPHDNATWTEDIMQQYGGQEILWVPDNAPASIHSQTWEVEAYYGSTIMMEVYAIGTGLRHYWQYRANPAGSWIDVDLLDLPPWLTIGAEPAWNGYEFRCRVVDANGREACSEPVKVTIKYAEKKENPLYDDYSMAHLKLGNDGIYRTPRGETVYIAVDNHNDGGLVYWLSGNTLKDYVESFGQEYFDLTDWQALTALMDEDGYVVLTEESLSYLITTITGNANWGEDESYVPMYLFYDRKVERLAGSNRWATAIMVADAMKRQMDTEQFEAVIIASGNDFADALAGSYLSTVKSAPILLSWGNGGKYAYLDEDNIDYIRENLAPGGTVYILGGEKAVPASYEEALSDYNVRRLGGKNRFATNLMILEEAGVREGDEILVCTSTNFADSLSASATGKPILLVFNESGKLYGDQPAYLAGLKSCSFTIIGGESAVSKKLETAIGAYGSVSRLAGSNRFETSVKVARAYFENPEAAVLAYAWNYPDGLCGGALAYSMDAPLILTMTGFETQAEAYAQEQGITGGMVLGGETLISQPSVDMIFDGIIEEPEDPEDNTDPTDPEDGTEPTDPEDGTEPTEPDDSEDTGFTFDASRVYERMMAMQDEYPEGMGWTNDNYYGWNGGIYSGGFGCAGFAFALSDAAFGDLPARVITKDADAFYWVNPSLITQVDSISIADVRVGDILRVNNDGHSVIVLEVHSDYVVIAEGNYNSSIHWFRRLTAQQVAAADYIMTRYPE